jgi:hypothetical protein
MQPRVFDMRAAVRQRAERREAHDPEPLWLDEDAEVDAEGRVRSVVEDHGQERLDIAPGSLVDPRRCPARRTEARTSHA